MMLAEGSSPLTRGPLGSQGRRKPGRRLIPARAGSITTATPPPAQALAHPRSRGEHMTVQDKGEYILGSSPLARGTRSGQPSTHTTRGLIPARAGNTREEVFVRRYWAAHPRSRGEHPTCLASGAVMTGSSPLARGTRHPTTQERLGPRLIPARAGNTLSASPPRTPC